MTSSYLEQLLLCDVRLSFSAQGAESAFDLLARLDVLCLAADHKAHVFLQRHCTVPVCIAMFIIAHAQVIVTWTEPHCKEQLSALPVA